MHRLLVLGAYLFATPALAQQTVLYKISSGTGFVVNNEGHVITNAHVVKACKSISILTAKGEEQAELVAADSTQDLAVLKTGYISPYNAPLRWNIRDLKVGDPVVVMGYPGQEGSTGHYKFKKSTITSRNSRRWSSCLVTCQRRGKPWQRVRVARTTQNARSSSRKSKKAGMATMGVPGKWHMLTS
jgi:hypothetical protein